MKDRDWFLVVAYSLFAGATFGFAYAQMGLVPTLCSASDTGCIREWMLATSGWAAVAAASLTVYTINKQIRASNAQHLEQMSFQASERLLLSKQINRGTWPAFGTVKQIFVSMEEVTKPRTRERLASELGAAKFALATFKDAQIPEKRLQFQGNLPSIQGRADVCLQQYISSVEQILQLSDDEFDSKAGQDAIGAVMGQIVLAHGDLEDLIRDTDRFQERWRHLDR